MNVIDNGGVSRATLDRPTLPETNATPSAVADRIVAAAQTPTGADLSRIHAGIREVAQSNPELATATHAEVAKLLDPVDAGRFLSGIFDKVGDFFENIGKKVGEIIEKAQTTGTNGNPATTGPGLATPATAADAPATINFPSTVQGQFDQQWSNSFPGGSALEQGGTLVFDRKTGQIEMVNVGGLASTPGSFTPDYSIPADKQLVGVFHTHPYDSGATGVSFSGADVAVMINEDHNIIMAQSGDRQFVMMRTGETPANVNYTQLNNDQNARIQELVDGGMDFDAASSQAASELATELNLAYYEGTNGNLTRINP